MGVVNSFSILVHECDGLFFCGPRPWRSSRELDVLHYLKVCFPWLGRLPCWISSYDNSYFSKQGSWQFFYLPLQLLVFAISSKEIFQFSLPDKIFNLLLQIVAFVHVMPMVLVEAAIFIPITLVGISLHFLQPLQRRIVLDLHKNLFKWHVQGCILLIPYRRPCLVVSVFFFSCPSLLWTRTLFRMMRVISFHSLSSFPLLGYNCVFCIHKILGQMDEFGHSLRLILVKFVDE